MRNEHSNSKNEPPLHTKERKLQIQYTPGHRKSFCQIKQKQITTSSK